ncbi:MAG: (E)-4-hydroxy-3-methylbut-2-enyl-diphosphate synthase [Candidatus Cryptobacteroides sp.]|nr:(E)-4-hydroxy-3-methylbut-2-enyl-diphosphate synthase [Bacteroidales bacterium]MDD7609025.1 (E)-4-hydroxy-3-methylbut-2-enyl-diphosphate synthase [Bacteroidales bacterium]MDY5459341.1 (E)-4-hydroxy-3-methylbut-2-enyl-diphosphate synthase [Candidatus Cryptobacteroides sp.]
MAVRIGNPAIVLGKGHPIVIQTMCNTHTCDEEESIKQCIRLSEAGSQMIRLTVPGLQDVPHIKAIREALRERGIYTPIVADIHFSSQTAIEVAPFVDKVRINPGNFHKDHEKAREEFARLIEVCKENGTAIRIGVNHGSLGEYITSLYGNTPQAMALAAMEWVRMCVEQDFDKVVVSLKSSNTVTMVQAYRELVRLFKEEGVDFPLHVGVTEAGNGESGRIKSCVGIATLLEEGIGDTIRVSLTEDPQEELPVAAYLAARYSNAPAPKGLSAQEIEMLDAACTWGPKLMRGEVDDIPQEVDGHLRDEIMQAARKRFYKPEYIACPGCGRTMYNLQKAFEEVKAKTSHLQNVVIAVMGCIVNGPGEMADADWGYVGEGGGKVSIYKKNVPVLRHIPEAEAADKLLELIEEDQTLRDRQPRTL